MIDTGRPSLAWSTRSLLLCLGLALAGPASALTYQITPVSLVASGTTFTGTITTDDTLGPLAPANLVDWSIDVSGPLTFTITPANSGLNDTVFRMVTASASDIRVAFPDGNFQFNLLAPFTTTLPECANCDEGAVQLFRSDFGRNNQGLFVQDVVDGDPFLEDSQGPVVPLNATFYVAATAVPEPGTAALLALGLAGLACARHQRRPST